MVHAPQLLGSHLRFLELFLVMSAVFAKSVAIYKEKGKSVTFRPISGTSGINDVEWKYGKDLAADWYEKMGNLTCYGQFKGRCEVDPSTGALTITGLISEDAGLFSVRINDQKGGEFELKVISSVAKPSINESCAAERTYCLLTCEGETSDAEPITYEWPGVDGHTDMVLRITKDTETETFSCVMKNPVSNKSSDSIPNPFTESQTTAKMRAVWVRVVLVSVSVLGALAVVIGVAIRFLRKGKSGKDRGPYGPVSTQEPPIPGAGGTELQPLPIGNHARSNGDVSGGGANDSSSPVRTQNGPQRPEAAHVAGNLPQNPPVSAPQGASREDGVADEEVRNPLQNPPAPASQDATKKDEIRIQVEMHHESLPAPASQDSTEQGGVANGEVKNPLQNPPAPASQDAAKKDDIGVEIDNHDQVIAVPASQDTPERVGVADEEVRNPPPTPPAPAS